MCSSLLFPLADVLPSAGRSFLSGSRRLCIGRQLITWSIIVANQTTSIKSRDIVTTCCTWFGISRHYDRCNSRFELWCEVKNLTDQSNILQRWLIRRTTHDLEQFCNDVNEFLRSVSDDVQPLDDDLFPDVGHSPERSVIFPHEVEIKLSKVDERKSCGPDELPNWFLRVLSVWLAERLTAIFNASLCEGHVSILSRNCLIWYHYPSRTHLKISCLTSDHLSNRMIIQSAWNNNLSLGSWNYW